MESGGVIGWRMGCFGQHGELSLLTFWVYVDVFFCVFFAVEHMNGVNTPNPLDCSITCVNVKAQNCHVLSVLLITAFQKSLISRKYAVASKWKSKFLDY